MKKLKLIIAVMILFSLCLHANAQKTLTDTAKKADTTKKPQELFVNVGLQYISNLTYAGRRDETSVPILLPTLTLVSKQGFFLAAVGYYDLKGSRSEAEGVSVTPGYVFAFDKPRYYGGSISATKYFITGSSPIILSTFNATIDGQLYANPDNIVKVTVAGSYRFNKTTQNDNIEDVELSKDIWVIKTGSDKKNGLKFTPDATLYMGTQSFFQTFYSSDAMPIATQQEVRKYELLAFTGSAQLAYDIKRWQINFTPYYIKPFNTGQNGWYFLFTGGFNVTF